MAMDVDTSTMWSHSTLAANRTTTCMVSESSCYQLRAQQQHSKQRWDGIGSTKTSMIIKNAVIWSTNIMNNVRQRFRYAAQTV